MRYHLVVSATKDSARFAATMRNLYDRLQPHPAFVTVIDPGKRAATEQTFRDEKLTFGNTSGFAFYGGRSRRHGGARGYAWEAIAESGHPIVLYVEDRYRFVRSIDLTDAAYVLEREPSLVQMSFRIEGSDEPKGETLGSGVIRWRRRSSGFSTGPFLIRPRIARTFPWPKSGRPDEFETGIRAAVPKSRFGGWGLGDPWVVQVLNGD